MSSVPGALDYLVAQIRALPQCQPPVVVSDGWPASRGDAMVVIGVNPEEDDAGITADWAEISGQEYEAVEMPCIVVVRRAGGTAVKQARDDAFVIFDAIRDLVRSDRRFAGAIVPGLPARVSRWAVSQTAEARQAGEGRKCEIRFVVTWQHRA